MEIEGNFEIPPPQIEKTDMFEDPNTQIFQVEQDTVHEEEHMHNEYPTRGEVLMHGRHPLQVGASSQGGPLEWFLEYFGKLNELMVRIEHHTKRKSFKPKRSKGNTLISSEICMKISTSNKWLSINNNQIK